MNPEGSVLVATPTTSTPGGSNPAGLPFDTVLRGYERRQVDEFVAKVKGELAALKEELGEAQRKRRQADEHAEATERELRDLRAKSAHSEPRSVEDSFGRSEEHTSELQSRQYLVCRLLLEKKKKQT